MSSFNFNDFIIPLAMAAGGFAGGYYGEGYGDIMSGVALGAVGGGMITQLAGGDPMEDIRNQATSSMQQQQQVMDQWMAQQQKMWDVQNKQVEQIQPLQDEFLGQFGNILKGETNVADEPMFAGMFANIRNAEAQARNQVMETFPAGGARERALRSVGRNYADASSKLGGQISKWVFDTAGTLNLPYQAPSAGQLPQTGIGGYGELAKMQPEKVDPGLLYLLGRDSPTRKVTPEQGTAAAPDSNWSEYWQNRKDVYGHGVTGNM